MLKFVQKIVKEKMGFRFLHSLCKGHKGHRLNRRNIMSSQIIIKCLPPPLIFFFHNRHLITIFRSIWPSIVKTNDAAVFKLSSIYPPDFRYTVKTFFPDKPRISYSGLISLFVEFCVFYTLNSRRTNIYCLRRSVIKQFSTLNRF